MNTRMSKYYEDNDTTNSRVHKNQELYSSISKSDIEEFNINNNESVLGNNHDEINVEQIKKILDYKYNEAPRRSIKIEELEENTNEKEPTKEYDLNIILEKAKEEKPRDYEDERIRKLRDTQYDILKGLKLDEYEQEDLTAEEENLKNLINTITMNEVKNNEDSGDPLDMLSELKGNDNTEVLDGLKEEVTKSENIEVLDVMEDEMKKEQEKKLVNSFYTSSNELKARDFDESDDFSKDIESNNGVIKFVIAIIVIALLVGIGLIIKLLLFS